VGKIVFMNRLKLGCIYIYIYIYDFYLSSSCEYRHLSDTFHVYRLVK
jgi:hypothetical protein